MARQMETQFVYTVYMRQSGKTLWMCLRLSSGKQPKMSIQSGFDQNIYIFYKDVADTDAHRYVIK